VEATEKPQIPCEKPQIPCEKPQIPCEKPQIPCEKPLDYFCGCSKMSYGFLIFISIVSNGK